MRSVLLLVVFALAPLAAHAQGFRSADDLVDWQVTAEPRRAAVGEPVEVRLRAEIAEGWKLYAMDSPAGKPVAITLGEDGVLPGGLALRGITQGTPDEGYDPNFDTTVRTFSDEATFVATLATDAAEPGSYTVEGSVAFMVCDPRTCVPHFGKPFSTAVTLTPAGDAGSEPVPPPAADPFAGADADAELVLPGASAAETAPPSDPAASDPAVSFALPDDYAAARGGGLWAFLLLAVGAGLGALITPCVFPMIPLTVSYFTKHAEDRGRAVRMALVYGAAIVVTFTALGALAAALVGASGAQVIAANPWVNLFIALVFIVFALSLLGLFELRLPNALLNAVDRQSRTQGGLGGVLFMGLAITLVSFSCTAPFVGGLLAATVQGEWFYPVAGMLAFSATFAAPFVGFALFPNALGRLPRSGAWLGAVKVTLGFVELAAALKFLSNADLVWGWGLLSRPLAIALAAVIFALAGLYLLGKLPLAHEPVAERIGVGRLLSAVAFLGLSLYLLPGLFGAPLGALDAYLPPRSATDPGLLAARPAADAPPTDFAWHDEPDAAFAAARAAGKPVFIDFTGYTCTNCRAMEADVFPRPAVAARLSERFILLRLYTDDADRGPALQRYQLQLTGTTALPTYAIVDPATERLVDRYSGMASPEAFAAFLDRGAARFSEVLASR